MKILLSHLNGNSNTRAALYGMQRKDILYKYITSIAVFPSKFNTWIKNIKLLNKLFRKEYSIKIKEKTKCFPFKELGRQICQILHIQRLLKNETGFFSVDKGCRYIDHKTAKFLKRHNGEIDAVYCYEDSAIETFREAKKHNILCIYDLPIGYWRAMREFLEPEITKNPEWAVTLGGFNDSDKKLAKKDEEIKLADKIYVASTFTKKTLELYPNKLPDVKVIPYGFPPINVERKYTSTEGRKIKVLYVGGLSQRKGISYIFEAIEDIKNKVELTVVGRGNIDNCIVLKEALSKCTYIPTLPHHLVLKLMSENDVLLFPSLFEGFGLVITEAMSQGTPVITTDRTCGPDIITNEKDGWIIEPGTSEPIKELLKQFIEEPEILSKVGKEALKTASSRPWTKYEEELTEDVYNYFNK